MAVLVNTKMIFSGNFLEIYQYKQGILREYDRKEPEEKKQKSERGELLKRRFYSLSRAKQNIRRIINSNTDFCKFVTLTFRYNVTDLDFANYEFMKFLQRLKYQKGDIKYIAIVEFQTRGAVHYHLLTNQKYTPVKELEKIWGNGFVKINEIDNVSNLGNYVVKYLQKDILDERLKGRKAYFCSKNLQRPVEVINSDTCNNLKLMYNLDKRTPEFETDFKNEYTGEVHYSIFNLQQCV